MHLSAMPTAKSDLNTHLGITIRWSASPRSYLPVANGDAAATWPGGARFCCPRATDSVASPWRVRGGGVGC